MECWCTTHHIRELLDEFVVEFLRAEAASAPVELHPELKGVDASGTRATAFAAPPSAQVYGELYKRAGGEAYAYHAGELLEKSSFQPTIAALRAFLQGKKDAKAMWQSAHPYIVVLVEGGLAACEPCEASASSLSLPPQLQPAEQPPTEASLSSTVPSAQRAAFSAIVAAAAQSVARGIGGLVHSSMPAMLPEQDAVARQLHRPLQQQQQKKLLQQLERDSTPEAAYASAAALRTPVVLVGEWWPYTIADGLAVEGLLGSPLASRCGSNAHAALLEYYAAKKKLTALTVPASVCRAVAQEASPHDFEPGTVARAAADNHHISPMEFIQCAYLGQHSTDGRRYDGLGRYTFPNGDVYLGGMQDGQFHGHGVVFFRNTPGSDDGGSGGLPARANVASTRHPLPQARGDKGSVDDVEDRALQAFLNPDQTSTVSTAGAGESPVAGHYVFQDGLVYGSSGTEDMLAYAQRKRGTLWTYCHGSDRRLWEEYLQNVAPVLPHEALLGGARLLHIRKDAMAKKESTSESPAASADDTGEGLPMVLPRAFVHARTAPAFAKGQLTSIDDPRVTRWAEAAAAADERKAAFHLQRQKQEQAGSPPARSSRRPTMVGGGESVDARSEAPLELIESAIALQFAMAVPTEGLRADGRLEDTEADVVGAKDEVVGEDGVAAAALVTAPAAPQPALNLAVCRVLDVEDVNRALVQIVAAP
ncbi:hypothetical protein CGC20_16220 [Leishmania donovani]|uniref:MORN repeat family protein n=1 Tax=Leishmania donovani TaxID=5661 RepID=A0A504XY20_LEIDO|nr:hypothetical protein CGC20_16220 [Leishmania donovani]